LNKAFLVLAMLAFGIVPAEGERIVEVSFKGERAPSDLVLCNRPAQEFMSDSLSIDSLRVVKYFQERGFLDCQATISVRERTRGLEIIYEIARQEKYALWAEMIDITGPKDFDSEIGTILSRSDGQPATASGIENLADDIIGVYADHGYPYCEVRITDIVKSQRPFRIRLNLSVNPGPEVTVERIEFAGRKNLDLEFLRTYSGLQPPTRFSSVRFTSAQKRLATADFLNYVANYELRYADSPESGVLVFPIEEKPPLILDGGLGYSSRDKAVYGRFGATINGVLGKGRKLALDWSKKDKVSRQMAIAYSEPYPFGMPLSIEFELYQTDRDSLFVENGGIIGIKYIASNVYTYGVSVGASSVNPESYGSAYIAAKDRRKLSVTFSADSRDYRPNPQTGDYLRIEAQYVDENARATAVSAASNRSYRTAAFTFEKYLSLGRKSAFMGGLRGEGDFSQRVPLDRRFLLGGHGSLRGFSQDIFYVSRYAVATLEYRLLTSRNGRSYVFSDWAVMQTEDFGGEADVASDTEFEAGFGVGLAVGVRGGIATVEIGVPHDEGISAAKLHFGITAGF